MISDGTRDLLLHGIKAVFPKLSENIAAERNGAYPTKQKAVQKSASLLIIPTAKNITITLMLSVMRLLFMAILSTPLKTGSKPMFASFAVQLTAKFYEIHHVNKLKNLKGKEHWERVMIAKKRKTLVVCRHCHRSIIHKI